MTIEEFKEKIKPDRFGHRWGCFCPKKCIDCEEIKYFYDQTPDCFKMECPLRGEGK